MFPVRSDFTAQACDVHVDRAVEDDHLVAPDAAQHLLAREDHAPVGEQQVADKVHLMLLSTDTTKAPQERVARQTTKHGLYNALDIGGIWLQKANETR